MKTTTDNVITIYQCEECGFHYEDRELAEKCEAWCTEHHTCNIEITSHAEESRAGESLKSIKN